MEFTSVTIIVGATDESRAMTQTIETILHLCAPEDIAKIIPVRSQNAAPGCIAAISAMEKAHPGKVHGMVQTRPHIGGAIRDGFDAAQSSHIMLLPGDLAIGLACVPEMIRCAKEKPATIFKTSRWLQKNSFHGYSPLRRVLNGLAQVFLRLLFRAKITDLTNPVQIMPTSLYRSIDWQELNFPFLEELILVPLRLGTAFEEIPAQCYGRQEGKSKNSAHQTALYLRTALRVRFSLRKKLMK